MGFKNCFFSDEDEIMQDDNFGLTEEQVQFMEQEYEKHKNAGTIERPIDNNHLKDLVKSMKMNRGEESEQAIENWWYYKDLTESIIKSKADRYPNQKYTVDMTALLELEYIKDPKLLTVPGRAQELADFMGKTKKSILNKWHNIKKNRENPGSTPPKLDEDQKKFLEKTFKGNPGFTPKSVAIVLGLDPNNKKHVTQIRNWKDCRVRKANEDNPGSSTDEPRPGTSQALEPLRLDDGKWKCPYCAYSSKRRNVVNRHIKSQHNRNVVSAPVGRPQPSKN